MTQLIGVLCENKKKVIMLSDRMVSTGNGTLAFEHESKSDIISPHAMILTAGTIHETELIDDTKEEVKETTPIRKIAENLAENYRKIRKKRIEQEILEKVGLSSFQEFHEKHNLLHSGFVADLTEKIQNYNLEVSFLLGGVDEDSHLYRICEPGRCVVFDALGFCGIGVGDRHSDPVFAFYRFSPNLPEEEALRITFEAKKRAEMAGGVGRETDAWIIDKEGIYKVDDETIIHLEELHEKQEDISKFLKTAKIKRRKIKIS